MAEEDIPGPMVDKDLAELVNDVDLDLFDGMNDDESITEPSKLWTSAVVNPKPEKYIVDVTDKKLVIRMEYGCMYKLCRSILRGLKDDDLTILIQEVTRYRGKNMLKRL